MMKTKPLNILTKKELVKFFNKYSVNELKLFDIIFKFAIDYNTEEFKSIRDDVYTTKLNQITDYKEKDLNVTKLIDKAIVIPQDKERKLLTQDELTFLYALVDNASIYLDSIIDDDKCSFNDCIDVSVLRDALLGEFGDRKMIPVEKKYGIAG